ncbi:membrane protein [Candidatus Francisella endociliophora]|uniref:Membrane protein n=1 Tax=Candidatus Francisella endociliophora TaxID=653937 RepID=A0A097EQE0_9GAMM|nr:DUF4381 domain-containing protein [Francisella sp. FSC1006]AIT09783.1 membrane protein [Francisella sp. FSC1006]
MQTNNNLLDQLKDIYLPERVSQWWPLAYGWWIVLAIIILAILVFLVLLHFRKKKKQYIDSIVNDLRSEVDNTYQQKPKEVLQQISVYLKRVAMQKFPNENVKTLHGEAWLEFLDSKLKQPNFVNTKANMLGNSYKPVELSKQELDEIMSVAEKWLRRML